MAKPRVIKERTEEEKKLLVMRGVIAGMTSDQIAPLLGISERTLQYNYQKELTTGGHDANLQVVGALFKNCMEGNVTAQIFWCKTRLNWRETSSVEVTHAQRGVISDKELTPDEWDKQFSRSSSVEAAIGAPDSVGELPLF